MISALSSNSCLNPAFEWPVDIPAYCWVSIQCSNISPRATNITGDISVDLVTEFLQGLDLSSHPEIGKCLRLRSPSLKIFLVVEVVLSQ